MGSDQGGNVGDMATVVTKGIAVLPVVPEASVQRLRLSMFVVLRQRPQAKAHTTYLNDASQRLGSVHCGQGRMRSHEYAALGRVTVA